MQKEKFDLFDYLYIIFGVPWFFLMVMSSGLFSTIKIVLLGILFIVSLWEALLKRVGFNKKEFFYIMIFIIYFFITIVIGILNGFEFSLKSDFSLIQYYILIPICVLFFSTVWNLRNSRKDFIWKIIKLITFLLVLFDVVKVLSFRMGYNIPFFSFIQVTNNATNEILAIRVSNETSLMFLLPISVVMLLMERKKTKLDFVLYGGSFFLGTIYAVISGRKMLEIIIIVSFLLFLFYRIFKYSKTIKGLKRNFGIIFGIVVLIIIFYFIFRKISVIIGVENIIDSARQTLRNGLMFSDGGVLKRVNNTQALIDLWGHSPIWGNGLNAYAYDSLASETSKWSYEVVYIAALAQTGILGISILFFGVGYLVRRLWRNFKKSGNNLYLAILAGFLAFILAGATNPLVYFIWPWTITLLFSKK